MMNDNSLILYKGDNDLSRDKSVEKYDMHEDDEDYCEESPVKEVQNYIEVKFAERLEICDADRYYHGNQWSFEEEAALIARGQPRVTLNYVAQRVNTIAGIIDRLRNDPKAHPRTPNGEQGAELATLAINYQLDEQRWRQKRHEVVIDSCNSGIGGIKLKKIDGDKGDKEIGFDVVNSGRFYYDPQSRKADFSDAAFMGHIDFIPIDDALVLFPKKEENLGHAATTSWPFIDFGSYNQPQTSSTSAHKRVGIINHYYKKDGQWKLVVTTHNGWVLKKEDCFFRDQKGKSICDLIMFSAFVDHAGDRYGFFRNMKDIQDEINQRRSRALYWINRTQIIADNGAFDVSYGDDGKPSPPDLNAVREQAQSPTGIIIKNKGFDVNFQHGEFEVKGNLDLLVEAKSELEKFGANDELGGDGGADQSGRAMQIRQQAGLAKLGPYTITLNDWLLRVYRNLYCAIKDTWQGERWLRVTDNQDAIQMVPVNQPEIHPEFGIPTGRTINDISAIDVDILIDEGPDQMTAMQGTYETLTALANSGAPIPPEMVLEMSPLASEQKKKLIGMIDEQKNKPDPAQQAQQQKNEAEMQKMQAEMQMKMAELQAQRDLKAMDLEIKRIDVQLAQSKVDSEVHKHGMSLNAEQANQQEISSQFEQTNQLIMMLAQQVSALVQSQSAQYAGEMQEPVPQEMMQDQMQMPQEMQQDQESSFGAMLQPSPAPEEDYSGVSVSPTE